MENSPPTTPPPPQGAYSMEFDQFDDPNFNPFATKKAMQNSPPSSPPPPTGAYSMEVDKFDDPNFNPFASKKAMQNSPPGSPAPKPQVSVAEEEDALNVEIEPPKRAPPKLGANRKKVSF